MSPSSTRSNVPRFLEMMNALFGSIGVETEVLQLDVYREAVLQAEENWQNELVPLADMADLQPGNHYFVGATIRNEGRIVDMILTISVDATGAIALEQSDVVRAELGPTKENPDAMIEKAEGLLKTFSSVTVRLMEAFSGVS